MQHGTGFVSRQFSYLSGDITEEHRTGEKLKSSPTTQLVSQITYSGGRTVSYEYDAEERITKVTDSIDGITEYTYDALGQLLTEKKNGTVVNTMTYDNYGNIKTKNGTVYTYGNAQWKDLLTKVGNQTISYDNQGNPTSYLGHTLTWEKGRQLKSFDTNTYTYNANGIRTSKTVNGVTHTYTLDGTKILKEVWGNNTLVPLYDNEDSVCGIEYNGTAYWFYKNLQGDIISIANAGGDVIAKYTYDAWGKVCSIIDTDGNAITDNSNIAIINPYRYRGYYYDTEIGMYYLQSRYYDPTVGRFVNADFPTIFSIYDNAFMINYYTYCYNNCILYTDITGFVPKNSEVPPASSGYIPPKGGPRRKKTKGGKTGWEDAKGNIWIPDPSNHGGDHWDVTGKDGYINVGRDGKMWGGKGRVVFPKAAKSKLKVTAIIFGIVAVILLIYAIVRVSGFCMVSFI